MRPILGTAIAGAFIGEPFTGYDGDEFHGDSRSKN
jgi:hypothetical protein